MPGEGIVGPPTDEAYWHPERRRGSAPRPPRWQVVSGVGLAIAGNEDPYHRFDQARARALTLRRSGHPGATLLDRKTGYFVDPLTRERRATP